MGVRLTCPSVEDAEKVRLWRNQDLAPYRTAHYITKEQQEQFYRDHICSRDSNSRWWSVVKKVYDKELIGLTGLVGIEWENSTAEISLIMAPDIRGQGYGEQALGLLLDEGFGNMGLATIYGECYKCNPATGFWERMVEKYKGYKTILPRRKRWQGKLYDSIHFSFLRELTWDK